MKHLNKHIILIVLVLQVLLPFTNQAQKYSNKGDRYFDLNLFEDAIKYYDIEASNGKDREYKNYAKKQLAECYRIIGEFEEAEKAYRKVLKSKKNQSDPINYLNYGKSLKSSAKFAEAKLQFEEFIRLSPEDPRGAMYLESCDSAQLWLDANLDKTVKNLEAINSVSPDFAPVFSSEGKIVFTSSRIGSKRAFISFNGGMDIDYLDLYQFNVADLTGNEEVPVENVNTINTPKHEGPATFTKDGKEVYFTRTVKGITDKKTNETVNTLQVLYSKYDDSTNTWSEPISAFPFNSSEYSIGQPSISPDGKTIYFISDMPKGYGGTDIYYCTKDDKGEWVFPINAGSKVNTFGHELFPYIADDGLLYFSSNGHPGMGQLDIFHSKYENGEWGQVLNMQPPVNSIGNDFGIVLDGKAKRGFFSSDRFNGMGAEDIYSFAEQSPVEFEITNSTIRFKNTKLFDGLGYSAKDTTGNSIFVIDRNGYNLIEFDTTVVIEITAKKSIFPVNKYVVSIVKSEFGSKLIISSDNLPFSISFPNLENASNEKIVLTGETIENGIIEIPMLDKQNFIREIPEGTEISIEF